MVGTINQSFCEVYDIINHMEKNLYNKIPHKFIEMLEQNRDSNYQFNIDYSRNIDEQELLQETRVILSLIYRDYLCSPEERRKIISQDKLELERYEEQMQEKYSYDNLFKNKERTSVVKEESQEMTVYKEYFFTKIFDIIKSFFDKLSKK